MIQGEFDEIGQLFFEIELIAANGEIFSVNALLDTGSTRNVVTAMAETTFSTYLGKVVLDAQEYTLEVVAGPDLREVILGLPWLETRAVGRR